MRWIADGASLNEKNMARAERDRRACIPKRRSALIPLCHLAQSQDGYLTEEAMEDIAQLCGVTPAEVRGTASFYDMLKLEPVGRYVFAVCTNIACMLSGAYELLEHAERTSTSTSDRRPTMASSRSRRPNAWPVVTWRRACRSTTASSVRSTTPVSTS